MGKAGAWELLAVLTALSAHQLPHGDVGTAALPTHNGHEDSEMCVRATRTADSKGLWVSAYLCRAMRAVGLSPPEAHVAFSSA